MMTEKDDTLAQLFNDFSPEFNDKTDFMDRLNHKLDAVEFIKQRQENNSASIATDCWPPSPSA